MEGPDRGALPAASGLESLSPGRGWAADAGGEDAAEVVWIGVTDGAGDFADSLPGILEQLFGLGQPEFLEIVVEGHADRGGKEVGNISGVQVQGRRQVGQLDGVG